MNPERHDILEALRRNLRITCGELAYVLELPAKAVLGHLLALQRADRVQYHPGRYCAARGRKMLVWSAKEGA